MDSGSSDACLDAWESPFDGVHDGNSHVKPYDFKTLASRVLGMVVKSKTGEELRIRAIDAEEGELAEFDGAFKAGRERKLIDGTCLPFFVAPVVRGALSTDPKGQTGNRISNSVKRALFALFVHRPRDFFLKTRNYQ